MSLQSLWHQKKIPKASVRRFTQLIGCDYSSIAYKVATARPWTLDAHRGASKAIEATRSTQREMPLSIVRHASQDDSALSRCSRDGHVDWNNNRAPSRQTTMSNLRALWQRKYKPQSPTTTQDHQTPGGFAIAIGEQLDNLASYARTNGIDIPIRSPYSGDMVYRHQCLLSLGHFLGTQWNPHELNSSELLDTAAHVMGFRRDGELNRELFKRVIVMLETSLMTIEMAP